MMRHPGNGRHRMSARRGLGGARRRMWPSDVVGASDAARDYLARGVGLVRPAPPARVFRAFTGVGAATVGAGVARSTRACRGCRPLAGTLGVGAIAFGPVGRTRPI